VEQVGVRLGVVGPQGVEVVGQSLERVRPGAQQDVAERALSGRHIGGQEVPFHLDTRKGKQEDERGAFALLLCLPNQQLKWLSSKNITSQLLWYIISNNQVKAIVLLLCKKRPLWHYGEEGT